LFTGKLRDVVDAMISRRVNILCVQEIKWKRQKLNEVQDTDKLWYTITTAIKNGVDIVINKSLKDRVDMIILVKLLVVDLVINIIDAYNTLK
jgi:exonuclease III